VFYDLTHSNFPTQTSMNAVGALTTVTAMPDALTQLEVLPVPVYLGLRAMASLAQVRLLQVNHYSVL